MNATTGTLRWSVCFALALCFHAAGAAALMARWNESSDLAANAPVIMLELAPVTASPGIAQNELPLDAPLSKLAEPEPQPETSIEKVEAPAAAQAELLTTPPPKPLEKPKDKKPKQKYASVDSAPSIAEQRAKRAVAPAPGAASRDPDTLPNWKSQLIARLERYKRAPPEEPNAHGVAILGFSVDGSGGVHNARIIRSSGSSAIDRETLLLVQRAQPMPPPPPEIPAAKRAWEVLVRYNYR